LRKERSYRIDIDTGKRLKPPSPEHLEHMKSVGERLRKLADDGLCISYTKMAEIMGYLKQILNNWMTGEWYPDIYAMYRLSLEYPGTFEYVFLGEWRQLRADLAQKLGELSRPH
jgi:hypothetical protein